MTKLGLLVGAALVAACVGSQSCQAGQVLFDDFNSDPLVLNWTGNSIFIPVPAPVVPDQQGGTGPSVDLIGSPDFYDFQSGHGRYLDLDGSSGNGNVPAGQINSIATFAPGTYTLSFLLAGNLRGAPAQTTNVMLGSFLIASLTPAATDIFQLFSYTFTTSTAGVLSFIDAGPSNQQGDLLDDVTLSTVPLPASWILMLLGLGAGLACFAWKAKRGIVAFAAA